MKSNHKAYEDFKIHYYGGIMAIIERQRAEYPDTELHGYAHIARCLILTHVLATIHGLSYEEEMKCLIAIGLHDSGREGDGEDVWEEESAIIASDFCKTKSLGEKFAADVRSLITDKTDVDNLPNKMLVVCHDADCLDIIRCFGLQGFDEYRFASFRDTELISEARLRINLIQDTNALIYATNLEQEAFDNPSSLYTIEAGIRANRYGLGVELKVINQYV